MENDLQSVALFYQALIFLVMKLKDLQYLAHLIDCYMTTKNPLCILIQAIFDAYKNFSFL